MVTPAPFKILLHKEVISTDSRHFDEKTKTKIKTKCIELLSSHPLEAGEPLHGELAGYRKLKIFNNYRIIYRVDGGHKKVFILAVGIRRDEEVYREALRRLGK